ncbi:MULTISPECIES: hypothetical protein [Thiorhodovibrio]|nr:MULTISPECIES: hypothetical protein [Thiorhodovibrio]WPL13367.1 hypothetical protein Thiosp_03168 [Thiorhodovibrio litoralis]
MTHANSTLDDGEENVGGGCWKSEPLRLDQLFELHEDDIARLEAAI